MDYSNKNVLIATNNHDTAQKIKKFVVEKGFYVMKICENLDDIKRITNIEKPDLAIFDLNLIEDNFSENFMLSLNFNTIFINKSQKEHTDFSGFYHDFFSDVQINNVLNSGLKKFKLIKNENHIIVKENSSKIKLNIDKIFYIKTDNIYLKIYTKNKQYFSRTSLKSFLDKYNCGTFIRVHRSYAINKNHITKLQNNYLHINEISIPISRKYLNTIKLIFN
ncbi:MAG: LytTR family transcriptional regulator [Bacteroidales bacterium]|nr:LytTR family transcriptional regulator [Bacteroidales bacterium]